MLKVLAQFAKPATEFANWLGLQWQGGFGLPFSKVQCCFAPIVFIEPVPIIRADDSPAPQPRNARLYPLPLFFND